MTILTDKEKLAAAFLKWEIGYHTPDPARPNYTAEEWLALGQDKRAEASASYLIELLAKVPA